jgi:Rrf2 family protein
MFSRACEYAIQALLDLVERQPGVYTPVREVASQRNIPYHFLGKIVQQLTKRGLLIANKGPRGGIALSSPADEITLLQVVEAIDGLDITTRCLMGLPSCHDAAPCPLHIEWGKNREQIMEMLTQKTLKQLMEESGSNQTVV